MTTGTDALAVRRAAGLFRELPRAVIRVDGADRVRWLNGMLTNDVGALAVGHEKSGCYAVLLTPKGRIVADMQVLAREGAFWLDVDAAAAAPVVQTLERYIIADDVTLSDCSGEFDRLGVEGPAVFDVMHHFAPDASRLAPDACAEVVVHDLQVTVARFGWSGEAALQLFTPAGTGVALGERLLAAGAAVGLVEASGSVLETLRIEAGIPRHGAELDESVLPAEAGLERAIAIDKGCYTGQEVVERMRSQGRPSHHLVGVAVEGDAPLVPGAELGSDGKRAGEITSACRSAVAGQIALAYVRRAFCEPGTELEAAGTPVTVASLPFVPATAVRGGS